MFKGLRITKLLLAALIGVQINLSAQTVSLSITNLDKPISMDRKEGLIGQDETGIYQRIQIAHGASMFALTKLDLKGKSIAYKEVVPIDGMEKMRFSPHFFLSNGRLWMSVKHYMLKQKKITLLVQELDRSTLEYKGDPKVIAEDAFAKDADFTSDFLKPEGSAYFVLMHGNAKGCDYRLYNSSFEPVRDNAHTNMPFDGSTDGFPFDVVSGSTTKQVWEAKTNVGNVFSGTTGKRMTGMVCDTAGNLCINIFFTDCKRNANEGYIGNYLFLLPKGATNAAELKLDDNDNISFTSVHSDKSEIVCAGFYSVSGEILPQGTRYLRATFNGQVTVNKRQAFNHDLLYSISDKPYETILFGNKPTHEYHLMPFLEGNNGDAFLTFEHFTWTTTQPDAKGNTRTMQDIREIVAVRITSDGVVAWQHAIPRYLGLDDEVPQGKAEGSFVRVVRNDNFYAAYIDAPENITLSSPRELKQVKPFHKGVINLKDPSKRALVLATITPNGRLTRENLQEFALWVTAHPRHATIDARGNVTIPIVDNSQSADEENIYSKLAIIRFESTH